MFSNEGDGEFLRRHHLLRVHQKGVAVFQSQAPIRFPCQVVFIVMGPAGMFGIAGIFGISIVRSMEPDALFPLLLN